MPPSDAPDPLIVFDHTSVTLSGQPILRDISLQIQRGQTVAVIGESGCGKTVLMKSLIGLHRPSDGRILFEGKNLSQLSEAQLIRERLKFGYLFQGSALFDSLTVYDNVALGLREGRGLKEAEIRTIVRQRLQEVGLPEGVEQKKPAALSGGMKKRVGLARALAIDPEVMLYDEPTTGLDPIMTDVINELILRTRRQRPVTSLVVTHEMRTVLKVADRVVMVYPLSRLGPNESQILFDGPAEELPRATDMRVRQFVEGEAQERLDELARLA